MQDNCAISAPSRNIEVIGKRSNGFASMTLYEELLISPISCRFLFLIENLLKLG